MKIGIVKWINTILIICALVGFQNVANAREKVVERHEQKNNQIKEAWEKESKEINKQAGVKLYKDGVFEGSGKGFGGDIVVTVGIKNDEITKVEIIKAGSETPEYIERVKKELLPNIKKKGLENVDVVSGATLSSNGVLDAVDKALMKAKNN